MHPIRRRPCADPVQKQVPGDSDDEKGLTYRGPLQKPGLSEAKSGDDRAAFTAAPGFRFAQPGLQGKQGSRTPTDAVRNRLPFGKRAPCRARSSVGVPRRLCPWDSRIPRCGSDQVSRSRRLSMAGVSRRRPPRFQRAPRVPVIMPADMMSEPPGCRGDEPFARGHRTRPRPRQPESPAGVLQEERGSGFYSLSPELSIFVATHVTTH